MAEVTKMLPYSVSSLYVVQQ